MNPLLIIVLAAELVFVVSKTTVPTIDLQTGVTNSVVDNFTLTCPQRDGQIQVAVNGVPTNTPMMVVSNEAVKKINAILTDMGKTNDPVNVVLPP